MDIDAGPPVCGFFRVSQANSGILEGHDLDLINSYRSTAHSLHLAVKLRGNSRGNFFFADIPSTSPLATLGIPDQRYQESATSYTSQWAEVAWFMQATGDVTDGSATVTPMPLYALYRRQRLAVPDPDPSLAPPTKASDPANITQYPFVSQQVSGAFSGFFNSPLDLTDPTRRFATGSTTYPTLATQFATGQTSVDYSGADLVLSDVLSFDVSLLITNVGGVVEDDFTDLSNRTGNSTILQYSNTNTQYAGTVFDTWSQLIDNQSNYGGPLITGQTTPPAWSVGGAATSIPFYQAANGAKIQVKAIQVIIRCWDFKTSQTRQLTVIQDL